VACVLRQILNVPWGCVDGFRDTNSQLTLMRREILNKETLELEC
jgi:hypothetical protein